MMNCKVLIANRGEIAIRIAKTCRKVGIKPYGIYSEADKESLHVKHCDEAFNIGGSLPLESYLMVDKVIDAAKNLGCDMIHPGYGFLSESSKFAKRCKKEGITFIGPSAEVMAISGDKVKARQVASRVAPVVDGDEVSNEKEAIELIDKIGYPVILKAVEGGGGRGLRILRSAEEIQERFTSSQTESMMSFGSGRIYIEQYLENPKHIEVQIVADNSDVIQLGERECSIQRRHQKLIEETPSAALTNETREMILQTAVEIMEEIDYNNAGTVEFLFKDNRFFFMEINARIQVEHPITEVVTGVDIIEQQLREALGHGLSIKQETIKPKGHAIECRINAEHPISFVPFSGKVSKFKIPEGDGIRVDTALYPGYSIPHFYDSLIAKLICYGSDRKMAIERMKISLSTLRISGIPTSIPFHISALNDARFVDGSYNTSFVDGVKPFSSKDGELAAAILSAIPEKIASKRIYKKQELVDDPWIVGRFDWADPFDVHHRFSSPSSSRWFM
jgi:acetyl-CoA carboxylase, biotin carboxylase subunit